MCLTKLLDIPQEYKDSSTEHIGYKVFRNSIELCNNVYLSPIYYHTYKSNEWVEDNKDIKIDVKQISWNDGIPSTLTSKYPTGFHIFLFHDDAVNWLNANYINGNLGLYSLFVKKVKFKKVVAYGMQNINGSEAEEIGNSVVAKQICIVDE